VVVSVFLHIQRNSIYDPQPSETDSGSPRVRSLRFPGKLCGKVVNNVPPPTLVGGVRGMPLIQRLLLSATLRVSFVSHPHGAQHSVGPFIATIWHAPVRSFRRRGLVEEEVMG
jgi:hypothetical protein